VRVDGQIVTDPLSWVDLDVQRITREGSAQRAAPLTLALNKPRGVVSTRCDERGRQTVYDLLPRELSWVFPVGRLDAESEGLLILTNDSGLAVRLTEPEHRVPKTYHVTVRGTLTDSALRQLRDGIRLSDGPTRPAKVRVVAADRDETVLAVVLTEGRNRQIRRMCAAIHHRVRRLVRVAIGGYQLAELPTGACWQLSADDVRQLTKGSPPIHSQ
jgi:23S rRNA pseudouridine2605 synthase